MQDFFKPLYILSDIAEKLEIPTNTIRSWINTGFIVTEASDRRGKGTHSFFAIHDVIKIMIAVEMYHLGLGPKSFFQFIDYIILQVEKKLQVLVKNTFFRPVSDSIEQENREMAKDFVEPAKSIAIKAMDIAAHIRDVDRFYVLYYKQGSVVIKNQNDPKIYLDDSPDVIKIIIDCFELANKAFRLFSVMPKRS
jgi:hypothetical protein